MNGRIMHEIELSLKSEVGFFSSASLCYLCLITTRMWLHISAAYLLIPYGVLRLLFWVDDDALEIMEWSATAN